MKLYVEEVGAEQLNDLSAAVVSSICRVEVNAATWRKARLGEISNRVASAISREFESDLAGLPGGSVAFTTVPTAGRVLMRAADVSRVHDLKSLDAIQLASATLAREVDPGCSRFVCFDKSLGDEALTLGFELISTS